MGASASVEWNIIRDGVFSDEFLNRNFTTSERSVALIENLSEQLEADLKVTSKSYEARQVFAQIILSWTELEFDGVILKNENRTKFQAFQFLECLKGDYGIPLAHISYGVTPDLNAAETFLRDSEVEIISCSDETFKVIEHHVKENCKVKGLINVASGMQLSDGLIPPMPPQ